MARLINKHIVPAGPPDRGTAVALGRTNQQQQQIAGSAGFVGDATTITGATLTTANSGARVVLQGPNATGPASISGGGEGLFMVDDSGNIDVSLTPTAGLVLATGDGVWNQINWFDGTNEIADIQSIPEGTYGGGTLGFVAGVNNEGGDGAVTLLMIGSGSNQIIQANCGIGFFGASPPLSQPGTPSTLAGVITLLESYGMCVTPT